MKSIIRKTSCCNASWAAFLSVALLLGIAAPVAALEVTAGVPEDKWVIVPEPLFMRPPVSWAPDGAKTTVLAAGLRTEDGVRKFLEPEFKALGVDREKFYERARGNTANLLETLEPEVVRDGDGVITHAVLRSEDALTASVIFVPGFAGRFEEWFGPELLAAIPNANTIFLFPKLAGPHAEFGDVLLSAYKNSAWPASLELFEISTERVRVTGRYSDD